MYQVILFSLRGISRTTKLAYNTVVTVIRDAALKAQMVHNEEVQEVETDAIAADEFWSFVKKQKNFHRSQKYEAQLSEVLPLPKVRGFKNEIYINFSFSTRDKNFFLRSRSDLLSALSSYQINI